MVPYDKGQNPPRNSRVEIFAGEGADGRCARLQPKKTRPDEGRVEQQRGG